MQEKITIKLKRLSDDFDDIQVPSYSTAGSAGMDLRAAITDIKIIPSGKIALIPTNLSVEIPLGYELQVRPRSGLAANHGIGIVNSPGTIDSDYRGEIKVILINFSDEDFVIKRGDRIAQMVLSRVYQAEISETESLNSSIRGEGGFGHTGKH